MKPILSKNDLPIDKDDFLIEFNYLIKDLNKIKLI